MKVLLATDGSSYSEMAIKKLCALFEESDNTKIRIISVAEPVLVGTDPMGVSAAYYEQTVEEALKSASKAVEKAESEIRQHLPWIGNDLTSAVITGPAKSAIVEEAERWKADLIIVGSHGHGFWGRALIGSVSDAVLHHAPCSVLVVRPEKD